MRLMMVEVKQNIDLLSPSNNWALFIPPRGPVNQGFTVQPIKKSWLIE